MERGEPGVLILLLTVRLRLCLSIRLRRHLDLERDATHLTIVNKCGNSIQVW